MDQAYFIILGVFLSLFGTIYTYLTYRNRERLALIDSGLPLDTFKQMTREKGTMILAIGLVLIGFSVGVISGFFFERYLLSNFLPKNSRNCPQAYLTTVPLGIGVGLIISFLINRRSR